MKNKKYILIAQDDEDDQFLLSSAFKEISKETELVFVENGIELVDHFRKYDEGIINLPALLIVDLNMPRKNGKEAIRELMNKTYYGSFKTIVFSTTGNEIEKMKCREMGINDFFVKPSDYTTLLNVVTEFKKMARIV